jgi:hypothetical protein
MQMSTREAKTDADPLWLPKVMHEAKEATSHQVMAKTTRH